MQIWIMQRNLNKSVFYAFAYDKKLVLESASMHKMDINRTIMTPTNKYNSSKQAQLTGPYKTITS